MQGGLCGSQLVHRRGKRLGRNGRLQGIIGVEQILFGSQATVFTEADFGFNLGQTERTHGKEIMTTINFSSGAGALGHDKAHIAIGSGGFNLGGSPGNTTLRIGRQRIGGICALKRAQQS